MPELEALVADYKAKAKKLGYVPMLQFRATRCGEGPEAWLRAHGRSSRPSTTLRA